MWYNFISSIKREEKLCEIILESWLYKMKATLIPLILTKCFNGNNTKKTQKGLIDFYGRNTASKYIAECGVASRRKAEELIAQGRVKVNGITVTEMGIK